MLFEDFLQLMCRSPWNAVIPDCWAAHMQSVVEVHYRRKVHALKHLGQKNRRIASLDEWRTLLDAENLPEVKEQSRVEGWEALSQHQMALLYDEFCADKGVATSDWRSPRSSPATSPQPGGSHWREERSTSPDKEEVSPSKAQEEDTHEEWEADETAGAADKEHEKRQGQPDATIPQASLDEHHRCASKATSTALLVDNEVTPGRIRPSSSRRSADTDRRPHQINTKPAALRDSARRAPMSARSTGRLSTPRHVASNALGPQTFRPHTARLRTPSLQPPDISLLRAQRSPLKAREAGFINDALRIPTSPWYDLHQQLEPKLSFTAPCGTHMYVKYMQYLRRERSLTGTSKSRRPRYPVPSPR